MATITRNLKPINEYLVWVAGDVTNGDVLGVYESLGNRSAHRVTIESSGGDAVIRLNVVQKIYKPIGEFHNSWVGVGAGGMRESPYLVGEVKKATDQITVASGTAMVFDSSEIAITDIEVVTKTSGLRIIVT